MGLPKPNPPHPALETSELLTELRASATDLAQFVEAASRSRLSYILISEQAVSGWQERGGLVQGGPLAPGPGQDGRPGVVQNMSS